MQTADKLIIPGGGGGGGYSLTRGYSNRDVPLDGVAFSRLE